MWRTFRNTGRSNSTIVPPKLSVLRISWIDAAEMTKLYWAIENTAICSRRRLSRGIETGAGRLRHRDPMGCISRQMDSKYFSIAGYISSMPTT